MQKKKEFKKRGNTGLMHTAHIINHFSQSFLNLFQCWFNTPCGRERSLSNLTTSTKAVGWQREVCPTSTKAVGWQREVCPTSTTSTKAVWATERSLSNFNNFHKSWWNQHLQPSFSRSSQWYTVQPFHSVATLARTSLTMITTTTATKQRISKERGRKKPLWG